LWRQAERVLAPTLLIYGGRDQLVGYRMARKAARSFRDSRLLSLPDAGHVAMMEYPGVVARAFRELMAQAGGDGGADAGSRADAGGGDDGSRSDGSRDDDSTETGGRGAAEGTEAGS
ncbi:alpha/beta fold hydrolase, partial [Streptomyces murinus]